MMRAVTDKSSPATAAELKPCIHDSADSFSYILPPKPNPSADTGLAIKSNRNYSSSPPLSPNSMDVFTIGPVVALKLLCGGIEALVKITGDVPPTPPPAFTTPPNMRGMQAEKENIARSNSYQNFAELHKRPRTPSSSSAGSDDIDGVSFKKTHMSSPALVPTQPYIIIGENAEPLNVQHGAITRKFYSKHPPPISMEDYLMRIHKFCPMSTAVYLATSFYIHKLAVDERAIPVTRRNSHRLLLAGLRVAMKALEDLSYPHSRFAKVGGVSESELARLEISFCFLTNFEFKTSKERLLEHAISLKEISSLQGAMNFIPRMSLKTKRKSAVGAQEILDTLPTTTTKLQIANYPLYLQPDSRKKTQGQSKILCCHNMADVETILAGKYPAKAHAKKVVEWMRKTGQDIRGVLFLEGQKTRMIEDNDGEAPFRQRRYFYYLTGCLLPDSYFMYDIESEKSTLFIPPIDPESVIWSGLPVSKDEALSLYDVDAVRTTDQVATALAHPRSSVWVIAKQVSEHITLLEFKQKDFSLLKTAIEECRVVKDEYEIALIKKANNISSLGHTAVLKAVKNANNERELEALFIQKCMANGAREQAYHSIVASGTAGATLHYVNNAQPLAGKLNLLLDAGGEYACYASDITRTFPINGQFSPESKSIYKIVLKMQLDCIELLKEGVVWDDVHLAAHGIAIDGLLELGILQGSKKDILEARTSVAFFPHGLGHYLGMDTHDTGGHANYEDKDTIFRYLRVRGALPAGSIITVEPGIYFCRFIIEPYLKDPVHSAYINLEELNKYWDVGGIRIEDNLLITKSGYENLTTAVKDMGEMEKLING
ncbi:hypothetical protein BUE80_DR011387, partial [Diplocarpon rosae]